VDLLIQLAYSSAKENSLKGEHQPEGLSLEVPTNAHVVWKKGDPTSDFDDLDQAARNAGVAALITELPPVVSLLGCWLGHESRRADLRFVRDSRR
jgi:ubiquitin-conjugating enzyme E2 Q